MSDPRFEVEAIRPLVSHQRPTGRHLVVTFRCPTSGKQVNATHTVPQSSGVVHQVKERAKQTAWYEARRQVNTLLRGFLGTGTMGRMATDVASTALNAMPGVTSGPPSLSIHDQDAALVEAFKSVAAEFAWVRDGWVHRSAAGAMQSDLDRQLSDNPPPSRYDQLLTARMLVQVASAHRGISDEERTYLADAVDPDLGSLEALMNRPPLTKAELGEATPGSNRITMLTMAWTLALIDEHHAVEEVALLDRFGEELGLSPDERKQARDMARTWILDQALERAFAWGGHDAHARNEVTALGQRLGMTVEEIELAEARFQKRRA